MQNLCTCICNVAIGIWAVIRIPLAILCMHAVLTACNTYCMQYLLHSVLTACSTYCMQYLGTAQLGEYGFCIRPDGRTARLAEKESYREA